MVPAEAFTPTPEHKAVDPVEELAKANAALMQVADQLAMANREIADNRVTIARLGRDRDVLQQKVAKFEERANRDPVLHGEVPATPGLGASPSPGEANANVVYK